MNLKIEAFLNSDVDILKIKQNFVKAMNPTAVEEETVADLPYFDPKKYYGQYKNFQEAKLFIEEQKERYPCKWYGLKYEVKRYMCTSASHTTAVSRNYDKSSPRADLLCFSFTSLEYSKTKTQEYSLPEMKRNISTCREIVFQTLDGT